MGLFAGQKWCISGNPEYRAYWPSPEYREPFSMLPRHALSNFMVWNAVVGPWWAATAEIFKMVITVPALLYCHHAPSKH